MQDFNGTEILQDDEVAFVTVTRHGSSGYRKPNLKMGLVLKLTPKMVVVQEFNTGKTYTVPPHLVGVL